MICPRCNAETSDLVRNCEFCGQPLHDQDASRDRVTPAGANANAGSSAGQPDHAADGFPDGPPEYRPGRTAPVSPVGLGGYVPAGTPVGPPGGMPPSEVPRPSYGVGTPGGRGAGATGSGGGSRGDRWYTSPWPYVVAILVVIGVIAGVFLTRGSVKAYPELVVNNHPTLLDFYTDT